MIVELKDILWKRDGRTILNHIDWQIRRGENWALVGLNGSGKTSLLKMIAGYMWPSRGKVTVLNHRFGQTDLRKLRRSIGWVSWALQEQFHPHDPVIEIVISGKFASIGIYETVQEEDREKARSILEQLGLGHVIESQYLHLSQGEKQKVLIGRALMADPALLILDEPCNGLDVRARETLLETIQQMGSLPDGPSIIYVTHHIEEIIPAFRHTLLLKEGEVLASGLSREVLTSANLSHCFSLPLEVQWIYGRPWITVKK